MDQTGPFAPSHRATHKKKKPITFLFAQSFLFLFYFIPTHTSHSVNHIHPQFPCRHPPPPITHHYLPCVVSHGSFHPSNAAHRPNRTHSPSPSSRPSTPCAPRSILQSPSLPSKRPGPRTTLSCAISRLASGTSQRPSWPSSSQSSGASPTTRPSRTVRGFGLRYMSSKTNKNKKDQEARICSSHFQEPKEKQKQGLGYSFMRTCIGTNNKREPTHSRFLFVIILPLRYNLTE